MTSYDADAKQRFPMLNHFEKDQSGTPDQHYAFSVNDLRGPTVCDVSNL